MTNDIVVVEKVDKNNEFIMGGKEMSRADKLRYRMDLLEDELRSLKKQQKETEDEL